MDFWLQGLQFDILHALLCIFFSIWPFQGHQRSPEGHNSVITLEMDSWLRGLQFDILHALLCITYLIWPFQGHQRSPEGQNSKIRLEMESRLHGLQFGILHDPLWIILKFDPKWPKFDPIPNLLTSRSRSQNPVYFSSPKVGWMAHPLVSLYPCPECPKLVSFQNFNFDLDLWPLTFRAPKKFTKTLSLWCILCLWNFVRNPVLGSFLTKNLFLASPLKMPLEINQSNFWPIDLDPKKI